MWQLWLVTNVTACDISNSRWQEVELYVDIRDGIL